MSPDYTGPIQLSLTCMSPEGSFCFRNQKSMVDQKNGLGFLHVRWKYSFLFKYTWRSQFQCLFFFLTLLGSLFFFLFFFLSIIQTKLKVFSTASLLACRFVCKTLLDSLTYRNMVCLFRVFTKMWKTCTSRWLLWRMRDKNMRAALTLPK